MVYSLVDTGYNIVHDGNSISHVSNGTSLFKDDVILHIATDHTV